MEIGEYVDNVPELRRERLLSLLALIRRLYPDCVESIWYRMPTFESANGWMAVANQKRDLFL